MSGYDQLANQAINISIQILSNSGESVANKCIMKMADNY